MASYTEHLNLLKKNPATDGADTFNIETMLNENWDKVDKAVAKKADLGENGEIVPEQLPIYAQFSGASAMGNECFGGLLSINNIQGNTVLGGTPAYNAPVSMTSVESPIDLRIAGKNLILQSSMQYGEPGRPYGITIVQKNGIFTLSGTNSSSDEVYINLISFLKDKNFMLPAGEYTISLGVDSSIPESGIDVTLAKRVGNRNIGILSLSASSPKATFTLKQDTDKVFIFVSVSGGVNCDGVVIAPQIECGDQATEYEIPSGISVEIPLIGKDGQMLEPLRMAYKGTSESNKTPYADRILRKNGVWYIERNTMQVSLTDVGWSKLTNYMAPTQDGVSIEPGVTSSLTLCTHFPSKGTNSESAGIWTGKFIAIGNDVLPNGSATTVEEMQQFCAAQAETGTPVLICTPMSPPIYEELHPDVQVILSTLTVPGGTCSVWFSGEIPPSSADIGIPRGDFPCADVTGAYLLLNQHMQNQDNPHGVTAAQVGADAAGSAAAVQTNLTNHINNKNNPHGVTAAQVGAKADFSILPVSQGGTGVPTLAQLAQSLFPTSIGSLPDTSYNFAITGPQWNGNGYMSFQALMSQITANGGCRIVTGSYAGTGTYGNDSPCSLNFGFVPKFIIILEHHTKNYDTAHTFALFINPLPRTNRIAPSTTNYPYGALEVTWGTTVTWKISNSIEWRFSDYQSAVGQMNGAGYTYYYAAIG